MVNNTNKEVLMSELTGVWSDYYTWVKVNTDLKTEEKRAESATTMFIQHCRALEYSGHFREILWSEGFRTADKVDKPKQEQFTEEGLIGPAYDDAKKVWNYCPDCKSVKISHMSQSKGKEYQACYDCRQYLNMDGKKKDMGERRAKG